MRRLLRLMCLIGMACILSSCGNGDDTGGTESYSAGDGPFVLIAEWKTREDNTVIVTRKLKYSGNQNIQIRHGDPLISVAVEPKEPKEPFEILHMFNSIGLTTSIRPNETIVYGEPVQLDVSRGDTVSVLASFEYDGTRYSIPLKFKT